VTGFIATAAADTWGKIQIGQPNDLVGTATLLYTSANRLGENLRITFFSGAA